MSYSPRQSPAPCHSAWGVSLEKKHAPSSLLLAGLPTQYEVTQPVSQHRLGGGSMIGRPWSMGLMHQHRDKAYLEPSLESRL